MGRSGRQIYFAAAQPKASRRVKAIAGAWRASATAAADLVGQVFEDDLIEGAGGARWQDIRLRRAPGADPRTAAAARASPSSGFPG